MTVTVTPARLVLTTDGVAKTFAITISADRVRWYQVWQKLDGETEAALLTLNRDYYITGDPILTQATIGFASAPAATTEITIVRRTQVRNHIDYDNRQGASNSSDSQGLPMETHERGFDKPTRICQEILDGIDQSFLLPEGQEIIPGDKVRINFTNIFPALLTDNNLDGTYDWSEAHISNGVAVAVPGGRSGTTARAFDGCAMAPGTKLVQMYELSNSLGNADYRFPVPCYDASESVVPDTFNGNPGGVARFYGIDVAPNGTIWTINERDAGHLYTVSKVSADGSTLLGTSDIPGVTSSTGGGDIRVAPDGHVWVTGEVKSGKNLWKLDPDDLSLVEDFAVGTHFNPSDGQHSTHGIQFFGNDAYVVKSTGDPPREMLFKITNGTGTPAVHYTHAVNQDGQQLSIASDGKLYVASDTVLTTHDPDGTLIFSHPAGDFAAQVVKVDSLFNYYGQFSSNGAFTDRIWLYKYGPTTVKLWEKEIAAAASVERMNTIDFDANENPIVAGGAMPSLGTGNVAKLSKVDGSLIWIFDTQEGFGTQIDVYRIKVVGTSVYIVGQENPTYQGGGPAAIWKISDPPT